MIKYIKENNYFGNKYHDYRDIQIEATKWWVTLFFAPSDNLFQKNKEDFNIVINNYISKTEVEITKFINLLI